MAYSQKYTIVQFLEQVQDQQVFSMENWPLHVTLADVFAIDINQTLIEELAAFLATQHAVSAVAKEDRQFGKNEKRVSVTLLENSAEFQTLHNSLINFLQVRGAMFNSPQYTREGFLPHSTHQKHARLFNGDWVNINRLSLVDMFVDGDWTLRKVLKSFALKA